MEIFTLLPPWYQYMLVVVFGLIIGSFLNVFIYRFHTGRSLAGSSHCLSCQVPLLWYELLPVVSYLALCGRCRSCGSYIPVRYVLVEVLTALSFLLVFVLVPIGWMLFLWWVLMSMLVVVLVYDLYHLIIPNEMVIAITFTIGLMLALFWGEVWSWPILLMHLTSGFIAFSFYGGLWLISRGRWIGFGDAKLAFPLASWLGLWGTFSFIILSFWIGAVVSVALMGGVYLLKRGQQSLRKVPVAITMKSEVPFAPFLIISFLAVALFEADVLELMNLFFKL